MRTDVHQHLLPEDLIAALSRRTTAPRISHHQLHPAGDPASPCDPADHDPGRRAPHPQRPLEPSYGPVVLDAMIRAIGVDRLVYGSDRPVAAPPATGGLGAAVAHALQVTNPGWAFSGRASVAVLA